MPTHKKPESERFKGPAKYLEYFVARILITVLQRLPIGLAYRLGRAVGWLAWKTLSGRRRIVRKNLEIVNAWMDARRADGGGMIAEDGESEQNRNDPHHSSFISHPPSLALPLEAQVREVFLRSGANLFAGFTFSRMTPEQAARHIQIEGIEHLKDALGEGRGAVILLAHMGPWEALAQLPGLGRLHGIEAPFGAIYRPLNNAYLDAWYRAQREAKGTRLFGSRYKFYAPADFVRGGGLLGVLSDQRASGGERAAFFGCQTACTPLPGLLYLRAKSGLLSVSMTTLSRNCWRLCIRKVDAAPADATDRRRYMAQRVASAMETALADSILDGFWFTNRFKDVRRR